MTALSASGAGAGVGVGVGVGVFAVSGTSGTVAVNGAADGASSVGEIGGGAVTAGVTTTAAAGAALALGGSTRAKAIR